jgi:hypothetical protein
MPYRASFHAAVVACLCGMAVMARLAGAAKPSFLRLDPALMMAQTPSSSRTSDSPTTGESASAEELAKKLSNPVASLISVPFKSRACRKPLQQWACLQDSHTGRCLSLAAGGSHGRCELSSLTKRATIDRLFRAMAEVC